MHSPKGWMAGLMALAVGIFLLASPPQATATFELSLQEDGGPVNVVAFGPSFTPIFATSSTFGDYIVTFFSAAASDGAGGSNLLSAATRIQSMSTATHTLNLIVSNTDYTLPAASTLTVQSGMGGTYGAEAGFTAAAAFQMWADAGNNLRAIPGTFTNGLQTANPASGNGTTFDTGLDPAGSFARTGNYSITDRTSIRTTGLGDVNYASHVLVSTNPVKVPEPGTTTLLIMGIGSGLLALFTGRRHS